MGGISFGNAPFFYERQVTDMKKIVWALMALVIAAGCFGCAREPGRDALPMETEPPAASSPEENVTQPQTTPAETEPPPVYVSPLAVEDFLDFDTSSRGREHPPEIVMVHFTSAVVLDTENPYDMALVRGIFEDYEIGIHYIIDRDGVIYCYLPEDRAAWHAGNGSYGEEERYTNAMNQYSIGIEMLAIGSQTDMEPYLTPEQYAALPDGSAGFTDAQYEALKALLADICQRNEIPMDRTHIIGHNEYAPQKTDPGELFDWGRVVPAGEG